MKLFNVNPEQHRWASALQTLFENNKINFEPVSNSESWEAEYVLGPLYFVPKGIPKFEDRGSLVLGSTLKDAKRQIDVLLKHGVYRGDWQETRAIIHAQNNSLFTPERWQLISETFDYQGKPIPQTRHEEVGKVEANGTVSISRGAARRIHTLSPSLTSDWSLVAAMAKMDEKSLPLQFDLLEEMDAIKRKQSMALAGCFEMDAGDGKLSLKVYIQWGEGVLPRYYGVDGKGRLLFYLAGQRLLLLKRHGSRQEKSFPSLEQKLQPVPKSKAVSKKPNIVFIHTDQQCHSTISALGARHIHTPNMDRLVKSGVAFTHSYSANPVCCPARTVWYTGRASCENGVLQNSFPVRKDLPDLGQWFGKHGYDAVYSGKWHVPEREFRDSFQVISAGHGLGEYGDSASTRSVQGFLLNRNSEKPFFLSVGLLQPHDICYWIWENDKVLKDLFHSKSGVELPELPPNFKSRPEESDTFRHMRVQRSHENWSEHHWRYYLYIYHRMVEMVDAEIGRILDALEDGGLMENTIVIFSSDHGEGAACHGMTTKSILYDQASRVPLIIRGPGFAVDAKCESVVSGLDIAPTICDFAGIPWMPKQCGQSLMPLLKNPKERGRNYAIAESHISGRMVRTEKYKYITYKDGSTDQFFDMQVDPWEMKNLIRDPACASPVAEHRKILEQYESGLEILPEPPEGWPVKGKKGED